jgi:hypothetical protein
MDRSVGQLREFTYQRQNLPNAGDIEWIDRSDQISEKDFCRIQRSHAINLDWIDSITPLSSGDSVVKLTNDKVLNLSRRYKGELKARLH